MLVLLLAFTRIGQAAPWTFWARPTPARDPNALVTFHVPVTPLARLVRTTQLQFVRSLGQPNRGVIADVSDFLRGHASPGDIVITNFAWEPVYFHTGLPQGMKVAPSFPVYAKVRAEGLPSHVWSAMGARWIVWRRAWPAFFREQDCAQILKRLAATGAHVRLVSTIRETLFENRENVHFHRFANDTYVFARYGGLPDAQIYRVDWPADGTTAE
jgi:hypothetical protein